MSKSGSYKHTCRDCDGFYVGQTGRKLHTRLKQHELSIVLNKNNTGLASHFVESDHLSDFGNVQFIHSERKGKRLDLLEQLEIKKSIKQNKHILNDRLEFKNTMV